MELESAARELFRSNFGGTPAVVARAPGRIEFIGNHTDYNAGTVIGASIDRHVVVAARLRQDGRLVFASDTAPRVELSSRPLVRQSGAAAWVNYPLGVLQALASRGMPLPAGMEMAVAADLPTGAGLSSSAALELAAGLALAAVQGFSISREELVKSGREAENKFVGVPSGLLDQAVSGFGRRDHLVHIDCRGPEISLLPLPPGVRFWIFNTHEKHELVGSLYSRRHDECMEAVRRLRARHPAIQFLADLQPEQVRAANDLLPEPVYRRARHVVEEIQRVAAMSLALARGDLADAGGLLFASHESSRTLFENSTPQLDALVQTLRGRAGVFGARLTGGGFGGAVMALTDLSFDADAAARVAQVHATQFGTPPGVLTCATADGATLLRRG